MTNEFSIPPVVFSLFPILPAELRCKIWRWAAQHPRLVEIEYCQAVDFSTDRGTHPEHRVCPKSRLPPVLLRVSHESREEAMKAYEMRTFDSDTGMSNQRYIYFNPRADIIYFGEKNCLSTMIRVFMQATQDGKEISRVAMGVEKRCKSYQCPHDKLAQHHYYLINEIRILHGFDSDVWVDPVTGCLWTGCPGLKEVFFVVKSTDWNVAAGAVDAMVGFRPAITNGITEDQISSKKDLELMVRCIEYRISLHGVQEYKWSTEAPKFHFVSMAPVHVGPFDYDDRVHSTVLIEQEGIKRLEQNNWSFLKRLESRTRCHITIPNKPFPRRQPVEIRLFGTYAEMKSAKQAIREKAMTYGQIQKWRSETTWEPIKREAEEPTIEEIRSQIKSLCMRHLTSTI